jgi:hypothetical protein
VRCGVSADQLIAGAFGRETALPSLEIAHDRTDQLVGGCGPGYACIYLNTFSWKDASTPMPMEANPRAVFERMFGKEPSREAEIAQKRVERSLLDALVGELRNLQRKLGPDDRQIVNRYTDTIRELEQRIEQFESAQREARLDRPDKPSGIPAEYDDHVKLSLDLQTLAYQADITRVVSVQFSRELTMRSYPHIGVPDAHHPVSHHRNDPLNLAKLTKINAYHMSLLAYLLDKLRGIPEGDGTLLDTVLLLYGSGISDGNQHDHYDLPCLIVSGPAMFKGGRHLRYPDRTPMANLLLTMTDKLGVPVDKLGDSTGRLPVEPLTGV